MEKLTKLKATIVELNKCKDDYSNSNIKIKLELDDEKLIDMFIVVKFSGSEMSGKLKAVYKFDLADNFNFLITDKF